MTHPLLKSLELFKKGYMNKKTGRSQFSDWGWVSSFTEPNGIDKFKMEFEGNKSIHHHIVIRNSLASRLFALIQNNRI